MAIDAGTVTKVFAGCVAVHLLVIGPFGLETVLHEAGEALGEAAGISPALHHH